MATNKKQMWVILKAKDATAKAFSSMKKRGQASVKALKQAFKGLEVAVLGVSTAILAVGVVATKKMISGTIALSKNAVKTAESFETLRTQFIAMTGSVEAGEEMFRSLWDTAKQIPFTIDEIAKSAKIFKAWGAMGEDVEVSMKAIADASAFAGTNMELMATTLGRAYQQGTLLTRGPGALVRGLMQTKLGIDDITKLSLPEFRKALNDLLTNPEYGLAGMSDKLAETFKGIKSMISDSMTVIKLEIANAGLFEEVKKFGEYIRDFLRQDEFLKWFRRLGEIGGDVVKNLREKIEEMVQSGEMEELLKDWINNIKTFKNILLTVIENIPNITRAMMNMVTSVLLGMEKVADVLDKMIKGAGKVILWKVEMDRNSLELAQHQIRKRAKNIKNEVNKELIDYDVTDSIEKYEKILQNIEGIRKEEASQILILKRGIKNYRDLEKQGLDVTEELVTRYYEIDDILKTVQEREFKRADAMQTQIDKKNAEVDVWKNGIQLGKNFASIQEEIDKITRQINQQTEGIANNLRDGKEQSVGMGDNLAVFADEIIDMEKELNRRFGKGDALGGLDEEQIKTVSDRYSDFIEMIKKKNKKIADIAEETAGAMTNSFENLFFDTMTGQFKSLRDYAQGFLQDMSKIIAKQLAMKATMALMGGETPTGAQGIAHEGMASVPKFATGGMIGGRDNIPILASAGEMILNKRQQMNLFNMIKNGGVGGGTTVNNYISAMDGADVYRTLDKNRDQLMGVIRKEAVNGNRTRRF